MSRPWLTPLVDVLDSRTEPIDFFFRDDDAGWDDVGLLALCNRFRDKATLDIAAIPMAIDNNLARELRSRQDHVAVHQHGFVHVNHAKSGKKCEFGPDRTTDAVVRDIQNGWAQLSDLFENTLQPIFTPPWNRCSEATAQALADHGFRVLSRDRGEHHFGIAGLLEVPVALDWVRHRESLGERFAEKCSDPTQIRPVGVMLHHEVMTAPDLDRVSELLELLEAHPNVRLTTMMKLADTARRKETQLEAVPTS